MPESGNGSEVLLVSPPDVFSRYPYLGLCWLAGSLRDRGIGVEILDCAALGMSSVEDVVEYVVLKRPVVIGITATSMMLRRCYNLAQALQSGYPSGTIVVGGSHINADPEILVPMGVPYGFQGECEETFARFCEEVLGGKKPEGLPGLLTSEDGKLMREEPAFCPDLDALPDPAYDLLPVDKYYSPNAAGHVMSMISSRGCPYNCIFCTKLQQTKYRYQRTANVLRQLEELAARHAVKWIEFVDEVFTLNRKRLTELCNELIDRRLGFTWGAQTRPDLLTDDTLALMREAGCRKMSFGVETGSERVRYQDKKKVRDQAFFEAVRLCEKHGIRSTAHYIYGHPTETRGEMLETLRFARRLPSRLATFTLMMPIPGSELFEQAVQEGVVPRDVWTSFMLGERSQPFYYPEGVDPEFVNRLYRSSWLRWYLTPRTIWRNVGYLLRPGQIYANARALLIQASGKRYDK